MLNRRGNGAGMSTESDDSRDFEDQEADQSGADDFYVDSGSEDYMDDSEDGEDLQMPIRDDDSPLEEPDNP